MFASGFQDPHYYDGTYHMGANDGPLQGGSSSLPPTQHCFRWTCLPPAARLTPANYDLIERVSAGYIMNTFNLDRLRLQTGLRLEATHEYGMGYLVNPVAGPNGDGMDNNGNWIGTTPVTNVQSYIDPLPSIQARYAFTPATAVRAVYARGISRPNQYDLVPYVLPTGNTIRRGGLHRRPQRTAHPCQQLRSASGAGTEALRPDSSRILL